MKQLAHDHKKNHRFTSAYSPWVKGTLERYTKTIQHAYRCLQSKIQLGPQNWPCGMGMIMTALNEAPLKRLHVRHDSVYRSPLEVVTGISAGRATIHTNIVG